MPSLRGIAAGIYTVISLPLSAYYAAHVGVNHAQPEVARRYADLALWHIAGGPFASVEAASSSSGAHSDGRDTREEGPLPEHRDILTDFKSSSDEE